jgi:2-succinyl-6-hydroxy-2,4-cyclohexadiene-1-carboxylate synthase
MAETVVLLHGFAGTRHGWDLVAERLHPERYRPLALDLPGHGSELARRPISFEGCVEHVLARAPRRFVLGGYSLGGRIALHVALAAPERVSRLVLVSTSAGIEDDEARAARRDSDEELARMLEREPFDEFVTRWNAQELFAGDPERVRELASADLRRNDPASLAAVLRGLGAGAMAPLWGRLGRLEMPVRVVAGIRDRRYVYRGERIAALARAGELVLLPGGHRLALESPAALAGAIATRRPGA